MPDGTRVVSGSWLGLLRIWEVASGEEVAVLRGHEYGVSCVAFSRDGKRVISGSGDGTIRIWVIATAESSVLNLHGGVVDFSTHADSSLVVGFADGSLAYYQNLGDKRMFVGNYVGRR